MDDAIQRLESLVALARGYASAISWRTAGELQTLATMSGRKPGEPVFVETRKQRFVFSLDTVIAPNMSTCVQAPNGFWLFDESFIHPDWLTGLSDVYIDSAAGNDDNQGIYTSTPGIPKPLKTAQEFLRRWGARTVSANAGLEVRVHILNPIHNGDRLELLFASAKDTFVRVLGENTTTLHQGALDAVGGFTPWQPNGAGGGAPTIITDTAIASWAPYYSKRIHFPRVNAYAYIGPDLGGHACRISVPQQNDEPNFNPIPANVFPIDGDTYVIEDPVLVNFGRTSITSVLDTEGQFGSESETQVSNITIPTNPNDRQFSVGCSTSNPFYFFNCPIDGAFLNDPAMGIGLLSNCRVWGLTEISMSQSPSGGMGFLGGAIIRTDMVPAIARVSGGLGDAGVLDYHTTVFNGYVIVHGGTQIRSISVWDSPKFGDNPDGHAILLGTPGHHSSAGMCKLGDRAGFPIFGNGAQGVGIWVGESTDGNWEHLPNIEGLAGQVKLASGGKARYFDEAANGYSAPVAETWMNLNTYGALHNQAEESHIIKA
jgi:hypothetical protein